MFEQGSEGQSHDRTSAFVVCSCFLAVCLMAAPFAAGQADKIGQWSTLPQTMPINPIHTALLKNGKVLVVSGSGNLQTNHVLLRRSVGPCLRDDHHADGWMGHVLQRNGPVGRRTHSDQRRQPATTTRFMGWPKSAIYDPATNTFTDTNSTGARPLVSDA